MKPIKEMPYHLNQDSQYYDLPFCYAIVINEGTYISDCYIVNQSGEKKEGLEFPVPIPNSQLSEISSYAELKLILWEKLWTPKD